jgi:integrase
MLLIQHLCEIPTRICRRSRVGVYQSSGLCSLTTLVRLGPLASQAVAIVRELQPLTGSGRYVFPSVRTTTRPMSENTINASLRRLGYGTDEVCGHGFRAMARTILDEVLGVRPDFIEHQLGHAVRDPNGRAYNRTAFLPARRQMMQQWADYLDRLKAAAGVIPLHAT